MQIRCVSGSLALINRSWYLSLPFWIMKRHYIALPTGPCKSATFHQIVLQLPFVPCWRTVKPVRCISSFQVVVVVVKSPVQFSVALRPQRLYGPLGTGSPGRPPRLLHSSWALRKSPILRWAVINYRLCVVTALGTSLLRLKSSGDALSTKRPGAAIDCQQPSITSAVIFWFYVSRSFIASMRIALFC